MRKNRALVCLICLGAALVTSCSQGTDPALIAALKASNSSSTDTTALEAKVDSLSKGLSSVSDDVSGLKKTIGQEVNDVGTQVRALKTQLGELETISTKIKTATEGNQSADAVAKLQQQFEKQLGSVQSDISSISKGIQNLDFEKFVEIANTAADSQGQIIKAKEDLKRCQVELETMTKTCEKHVLTIKELNDSIIGLKGEDVSKHPMVKDLQKKLDDANEKHKTIKGEYDQMKLLADKQAEEIRQLKAGGAVSATTEPAVAKPVRAFTYKVASATFRADTQQYTVLASFVEGEAPSVGSEVLIVDSDDNIVCRMRVDKIYAAEPDVGMPAQIGGETTNASTKNAPLKNYRVISSRVVSAEGR